MKRRLLAYTIISVVTVLSFCSVKAAAGMAAVAILDNASGGQCTLVGTWNNSTKTCTLTQDITEPAEALYTLSVLSDDVTLDGNGHTITGHSTAGSSSGVSLNGVKGVTVKNLTIKNYANGIAISNGATADKHNVIQGNSFWQDYVAVNISASYNDITGNIIDHVGRGVAAAGSSNAINYNLIDADWTGGIGINIDGSGNSVFGNTISGTDYSLFFASLASGNSINANNLLDSAADFGSGNSFSVSIFGLHWGNYWADYDAPGEGCNNIGFDDFCDSPRNIVGAASSDDDYPFVLKNGWNRYDFTWYDNVGGKNWVLVANPSNSGDIWADLTVSSLEKPLPVVPGNASGQLPGGRSVAAIFPGLVGGPVEVDSRGFQKTVVSQRMLWPSGGNSLEEVPGTWAYRMSDAYWWPWYDMQTPGFKNWVLVSNPNSFNVDVRISIGSAAPFYSTTIAPGAQTTPTFPGVIGGPLKVQAFVQGTASPAKVMASQRVLSNGDTAFNEVPGIPDAALASRYVWTWYDQKSAGAQNWILIANPPTNSSQIYYDIKIGTEVVAPVGSGPIAPGEEVIPQFPGKMAGPVEVRTYYNTANPTGTPARSIASQRSIWGPSFEEVPGIDADTLSATADWTWYDQNAGPGVKNWVLVANPSASDTISVTVSFINQADSQAVFAQADIGPGDRWIPQFDGKMGGPVHLSAFKKNTAIPVDVISSQRVLWNGYFNEVWGQ